jgi:hypothetical protein
MNTPDFWFSAIWNTFSAECNSQTCEYTPYAISSFGKKWIGGGLESELSLVERQANAISKFADVCAQTATTNETLLATIAGDSHLQNVVSEAASFLSRVCDSRYDGSSHDLTDSCISWHVTCGPGASLGASGGSWVEKFVSSDITYYPHQTSLYRFFTNSLHNTSLYQVELDRAAVYATMPVPCSRMSSAPKSAVEERFIATEASLPMGFQLSLHTILSSRLKSIGLDLSNQQFKNRKLACQGSIDGSLSTIDLSSASDCVSLALISVLFKDCPCLLFWLKYLRSESIMLPNKDVIQLPMISTMGNGYTFVILTLVFLSIVVGVARECKVKLIWNGPNMNCGVYGDDIIVPTELYDSVIAALQKLGFTPNLDKCFTGTDPFRESCGGDYLRGTCVRGVYLTSLNTDAELYSAINRLCQWSAVSGVVITKTLRMLRQRLKTNFLVPLSEEISAGIRTPLRALPLDWKSVPQSKLILKMMKLPPSWSGSTIYERLENVPLRVFIYSPDKMTMNSAFIHSEMGVMQAIIKGVVRGGYISSRRHVTRSKKSFGSVLSWDYPSDDLFPFTFRVGFLQNLCKVLSLLG